MKEILIQILNTFCPDNVFLQGTINPDVEYPQKFITFFVHYSQYNAFYDDDAHRAEWYVSVMFYSNNPAEIQTIPPQISSALKSAGFIPRNAGIDIISDVQTHTGWAMDFIYPENLS